MKFAGVLSLLVVLSMYGGVPTPAIANPAGSVSTPASARARATVLLGIEIERAASETKVYLKANGAIKDYNEVKLKKNVAAHRPERMYLDLKNMRLAGSMPLKRVGTALSKVRTGRRPDGVRVVFDSSSETLFDYTISRQPDGLLVTIPEKSVDTPTVAKAIETPVVADPAPESESVAAMAAEPQKVMAPVLATMRPQAKAPGDLDLLIVTAETPEQTQEWLDGSPGRNSSLKILKTAKIDEPISISFLITGVSPDGDGDYAVTVSFTLLDPNGKVVVNQRSFAKTAGRAPSSPAFLLADPVLDIILSHSDPVGKYRIIGIVEDLTNNKIVRTSSNFTLEK